MRSLLDRSTLTLLNSNGKYKGASHFDYKAALAKEAIKTLGEDRVALVEPAGYFENVRTS